MYIPKYFNVLTLSPNLYQEIPDNFEIREGIISFIQKIIAILNKYSGEILQKILSNLQPINHPILYNLTVPDDININFITNIDDNKDIKIYDKIITDLNHIIGYMNSQQKSANNTYYVNETNEVDASGSGSTPSNSMIMMH